MSRKINTANVAATIDALRKAKVINFDVPLDTVIEQMRGLPELASDYVIAWSKVVLVVRGFGEEGPSE